MKTYSGIPYGTWSDDGSQLLALLNVFVASKGRYDEARFGQNLLAWLTRGAFQAGGRVFDCGGQTRAALECLQAGAQYQAQNPMHCGNGALMRVLPAAMLPDTFGVPEEHALRAAMDQSVITHPQIISQVTCAVYVELCWLLRDGAAPGRHAVFEACRRLAARGLLTAAELPYLAKVEEFGRTALPNGSGFVVSTLWTAGWAIGVGNSVSDVLRWAVSLGGDTDTVACVAGGLAGLAYGIDDLAQTWKDQMTWSFP